MGQDDTKEAAATNTCGLCYCGETTWEYSGDPSWACFCHCEDCRRNCSAPVVGWLGVAASRFHWTGKAPRSFASSPGVTRYFCATCGTPMAFIADHYPGGMHLYAASLVEPQTFQPTFHVNWQSKLPWLVLSDDLPKYDGTLLTSPEDPKGYPEGV